MTKIDGGSKKEAARQVEESLRRLQTDCIDLIQHHEILRYEDPHRIFDEDGANAALILPVCTPASTLALSRASVINHLQSSSQNSAFLALFRQEKDTLPRLIQS